jgi:hypothetical protein
VRIRTTIDHRNRLEAAAIVEGDRGTAGQAPVGDALGRSAQTHAAGGSPPVQAGSIPGRHLQMHPAHARVVICPGGRRQAGPTARARRRSAGRSLRRGARHQDQEDAERDRPGRDQVGSRARGRAKSSSSRTPMCAPVRPRRDAAPVHHVPLFLSPTGLADGLALKELRYALRRFAPAAFPTAASGSPALRTDAASKQRPTRRFSTQVCVRLCQESITRDRTRSRSARC